MFAQSPSRVEWCVLGKYVPVKYDCASSPTGHVELRPNALAPPIPLSRHTCTCISPARVAPIIPALLTEICIWASTRVEAQYVYLRAGGVPTRHTHKSDGLHTRHLLESTHTNTHKHTFHGRFTKRAAIIPCKFRIVRFVVQFRGRRVLVHMSHHRPVWVHVTSPPRTHASYMSPTASTSMSQVTPRREVVEVVDAEGARRRETKASHP